MNSAPAPSTAPTTESTLRFLRTVWAMLLVSTFLYQRAAELAKPHVEKPLDSRFAVGIVVVAIISIGIGVWAQIARVRPAMQALQLKAEDQVSLKRWRLGAIVSCVVFESVGLYGFVLRFLGGTLLESLPFYGVAIVLMVFYWPQRP